MLTLWVLNLFISLGYNMYGFEVYTETGELGFKDSDIISFVYAEGEISTTQLTSIGGTNAPNYCFGVGLPEVDIFNVPDYNKRLPLVFFSLPLNCSMHSINLAPEIIGNSPPYYANFINICAVITEFVPIKWKTVTPIYDVDALNYDLTDEYGLRIYNETGELSFSSSLQAANIIAYKESLFAPSSSAGLQNPIDYIKIPEAPGFPEAEPYFCANTVGYYYDGNLVNPGINSCCIKRTGSDEYRFSGNVYFPPTYRRYYPDPNRFLAEGSKTIIFARL